MQAIERLDLHPVAFVRTLRARYGADLELSFSRYIYVRRVRKDARESFRVPIADVSHRWLRRELAALAPDQELALESRVRTGRSVRHIPMIDFVGLERGQLAAVMEVLPQYPVREAQVYFSGRSFHAYFPVLITPSEWVRFMASALLCNTPSRPQLVDQRWVGHRLIGGYGALRWSYNTVHYRGFPERVRNATLFERPP
jgi:hypothetical protein